MIQASDLDYDFLATKVQQLLDDAITVAIMYEEELGENSETLPEMPQARMKAMLNALANGDTKAFEEKFNQIQSDIDKVSEKYRDFSLLMFGPLNEINRAVGNFGNFSSIFEYPVSTTACSNREAMLRRKDGKKVRVTAKLADDVLDQTKETVFKVAKTTLVEGMGKVL